MSEGDNTYEATVNKVADYLEENFGAEWIDNYVEYRKTIIQDAKEIVKIVIKDDLKNE